MPIFDPAWRAVTASSVNGHPPWQDQFFLQWLQNWPWNHALASISRKRGID